jgi:U6 snRNA-associated Sm-like protein LSm7
MSAPPSASSSFKVITHPIAPFSPIYDFDLSPPRLSSNRSKLRLLSSYSLRCHSICSYPSNLFSFVLSFHFQPKPKKSTILDLNVYLDKSLRVKLAGGREVTGILKGFDQLVNLVLSDCEETMQGKDANEKPHTRKLGQVVARGTAVLVICPMDGLTEIENPFIQQQEMEQQSIE